MNKIKGVINAIIADLYYVDCNDTIYSCKPRGKFKQSDELTPVVGDIVDIEVRDDLSTIEHIHTRKNYFSRPQLSNVDVLFIVVSVLDPKPNLNNIDQLIAICEYKDIQPAIIFNKCDLASPDEYINIYNSVGVKMFKTIATDFTDISDILEYTQGKCCAFIGNTGVGKSSILNLFLKDIVLKTGETSKKLGRGKHTTRHVQLYKIKKDTYIADTPGFSAVDFTKYNFIDITNIDICFTEFVEYKGKCKYNTCLHYKEDDCAIIEAVNSGKISKSRYKSYYDMITQTKNYKPWEHKNDVNK